MCSIASPNPRGGETIPMLDQANTCVHVHNQILTCTMSTCACMYHAKRVDHIVPTALAFTNGNDRIAF